MLFTSAFLIFLTFTTPLQGEPIFPPNEKHNHGSSIVETPEGDLIAAWFHGGGERKSDDVLIQGSRKKKGGKSWSAPFVLADTPDLPDCNPTLFMDPRGTLWLFWIAVQDNEWGGSLLKYRYTNDYIQDGPPNWEWQDIIHVRPRKLEEQFSKIISDAESALKLLGSIPEEAMQLVNDGKEVANHKLSQRLGWMTRVHPIMISDTQMMLGLYSDVFNCSLAALTGDWGKTWSFSEAILYPQFNMLGNIQPSFVQRKSGEILAYMRDNGIPHNIRTAMSKDNGQTWGEYGMLPIRNPGSSVEAIALKSGNWALIANDLVEGRHKLSVYLSQDEGKTWPKHQTLEEAPPEEGSFSYPSMIQTLDGNLHATYSHTRKEVKGSTIKHVTFSEEWLHCGNQN